MLANIQNIRHYDYSTDLAFYGVIGGPKQKKKIFRPKVHNGVYFLVDVYEILFQ